MSSSIAITEWTSRTSASSIHRPPAAKTPPFVRISSTNLCACSVPSVSVLLQIRGETLRVSTARLVGHGSGLDLNAHSHVVDDKENVGLKFPTRHVGAFHALHIPWHVRDVYGAEVLLAAACGSFGSSDLS